MAAGQLVHGLGLFADGSRHEASSVRDVAMRRWERA